MSEKLKLALNKPQEAALKFAKARRGDSTIPGKGEWFMYSLVSGEVLFIDSDDCQDPDEMFAAAGVGARDPFTITLKKSAQGGRYLQVKRLSDAAEPVAVPHASQLEAQLQASIAQEKQRRESAFEAKLSESLAQRAPATTPAPVASSTHLHANPIALVPDARPRAGSLMASALVAAVDAVLIARDYAAAKGLTIEFFAEDVRAIAATLYIQHSKENPFGRAAGGRS